MSQVRVLVGPLTRKKTCMKIDTIVARAIDAAASQPVVGLRFKKGTSAAVRKTIKKAFEEVRPEFEEALIHRLEEMKYES